MVFAALAPTLAQAMVGASDDGKWVEVCSASGMVWLKAEGADAANAGSDQDKPLSDMGSHCPWCSFHGSAPGLLPVQLTPLAFAPAVLAVPEPAAVVLISGAQRTKQARAPPFVS